MGALATAIMLVLATEECCSTLRRALARLIRRLLDRNQADRAISTGPLNALLRLHARPIDVVVFHGSRRDLVLREASRLDAFSGYPVRT